VKGGRKEKSTCRTPPKNNKTDLGAHTKKGNCWPGIECVRGWGENLKHVLLGRVHLEGDGERVERSKVLEGFGGASGLEDYRGKRSKSGGNRRSEGGDL